MLRKQPFDMEVKYKPGVENAADYISRHLSQHATERTCSKLADKSTAHINFTMQQSLPRAITESELVQETEADQELQAVANAIQRNSWKKVPETTRNAYMRFQNELTVTPTGQLLRGNQMCIRSSLAEPLVVIAHEGHLGIVKTKQLLRQKVWFPGINKLVETNSTTACCVKYPLRPTTASRYRCLRYLQIRGSS